jgi:hypothetical protein
MSIRSHRGVVFNTESSAYAVSYGVTGGEHGEIFFPAEALRRRGEWERYMRIPGCRIGLLINFNKPTLIDGVKRFIL